MRYPDSRSDAIATFTADLPKLDKSAFLVDEVPAVDFWQINKGMVMIQLTAKNLHEVLTELRTMDYQVRSKVDFGQLPTFGGECPKYTGKVWSWDKSQILIGSGVGSGDFAGDLTIVSRAEFEGH